MFCHQIYSEASNPAENSGQGQELACNSFSTKTIFPAMDGPLGQDAQSVVVGFLIESGDGYCSSSSQRW